MTSAISISTFGADEKSKWGYSGKGDPSVWGELADEYRTCGVGAFQSPIDIDQSQIIQANTSPVSLNWKPFKPEIQDNGHTIQINTGAAAGFAKLNGKNYDLLQFHFHHLSEHTLGGEHANIEVHFVHQSQEGDLLVIGAMIQEGEESVALSKLWSQLPVSNEKAAGVQEIEPMQLMPTKSGAFRYKGSLTTSPCNEVVTWPVMTEPITASAKQIATFSKLYPDNHRPVQNTNRRFVLRGR